MKFTTATLALISSSLALAAPTTRAVSAAAADEWTLEGVTRTCTAEDTTCSWSFGIYTGSDDAIPAVFVVNATSSAPASQANGGPTVFGAYTITSGWSGQFGAGEGFTTISVIDYANKLIAYPAYKDTELGNGTTVSPDRSYPVQSLP
ncbi:small secreted protein [Seiridium cupressi]